MIKGENVYLRALEMTDLERCQRWINDPAVHRTLDFRTPLSLEQEREWLDRACRNSFENVHLAICTMADDRHIGTVSLMNGHPVHRRSTFGIMIGETDLHDCGYGTEATRLICRYGFEEMNLNKINLTVMADNPRGVRVYEKVGFVKEGLLREEFFIDGQYRDLIWMGLFRGQLK
jgi:RimJ/RimL family protein N-acetyltransferase